MVVNWEKPLSEEERLAYEADVRAFLDSDTTTRVAIDDGRSFHRARINIARPTTGAPSPYSIVDEIDERVALAREVQQAIRDFANSQTSEAVAEKYGRTFRLSLMQFSAFLCVDLEHLRRSVRSNPGFYLHGFIMAVERFLANCKCPELLFLLLL